MFYNAKNKNVSICNTDMDYIKFGTGSKNLIIVPGLGDGLKTVKGAALTLAYMYKIFSKDYTVYIFSRRNKLEKNTTTKNMADDLAYAMENLYINKTCVLGVSQGGMIAQHLTADYPEKVEKLVLAVTASCPNATLKNTVENWIDFAKNNEFEKLFIDTAEKTYTEHKLKMYRPFYKILIKLSKPKNLDRFIIQANACLTHNAYEKIKTITCPTLIVGGNQDKIVGESAAVYIANNIKNSVLEVYEGVGHGLYEEEKGFNKQVLNFLNN